MKPIHVRVELFDPISEETFPIHTDLDVSIARLDRETQRLDLDRLRLPWDEASRCFHVDAPDYPAGRDHYPCVNFAKMNFSKKQGCLLGYDEAQTARERLWAPARVPQWDSGWDDAHRTNEFLGPRGLRVPATAERPIVLRVPIRRLYVLGHRGAPLQYPENTLPAFREALDGGANGLEFDLCLLEDEGIAVFHDSQPTKQPPRADRTLFEKLPYELISPTFNILGRKAHFYKVEDGQVVAAGDRRLRRRNELDLIRLDFESAREVYRYAPVDGVEHRIIDFDAFLSFASEEADRLRLLFFDVKPPGRLASGRRAYRYGRRIGEALKRHPKLPERLVVCYANAKVLKRIRAGIESTGEDRCWFAFDAAGGLAPWIRGTTRGWTFLPGFVRSLLGRILPGVPNPLKVAKRLKTRVVSIGTLARPAHMDEIRSAVRDRDYRPLSPVEMVIHWTINDAEQWQHSVESGVNAVLTDKPGELIEFLAGLGIRVN